MPALDYLTIAINRIISDGKISRDELTELYKTIESILPTEIRSGLITRRKDSEKRKKLEEKELKLMNEPIASARFIVAGAQFEGRAEIIQRFVREDEKVFLLRDPHNAYSQNAIKILLNNGLGIGYVPEEYAQELAKYLDEGYPHKAYVLRIYIGRESNLPLIQVFILRKESDIPGLIFAKDIPQLNSNDIEYSKAKLVSEKKDNIFGDFINRFFK